MAEKTKIDIFKNNLVPRHEVLSEETKNDFLKTLNIVASQLPKILSTDPCVKLLNAKKGDVLKILRKSPTAGEYYYYRVVA